MKPPNPFALAGARAFVRTCRREGKSRKQRTSAPARRGRRSAQTAAAFADYQSGRLLARWPEGIFVNPFERGEIGPDLFVAACRMELEGIVSKRRDRPYQSGRSKHWVKVKNRKHPAMSRVMETFG
jgi:hypothetical protein